MIELKEDFEVVDDGARYILPSYQVDKELVRMEHGITLDFVRGNHNPEYSPNEGTLHEHILACMIHDLRHKNKVVRSRETSCMITKLQEALFWARERTIDRSKRDVLNTYND